MERPTLTEQQKTALAGAGATLVYLHGSVAEGAAREDSDVDVAVLFEHAPTDSIGATGAVLQILARFMPKREMDVAILNEASPLSKQIVASEGKFLYARLPDDALRFEPRAHVMRLEQELALKRVNL